MRGVARGHNLPRHRLGQVDRDGKAQALVAAAAGVDLRVNAHHLARGVEQRAARVAGVDGRIGLNERHGVVVGQGAAFGAHHAGGDRVVQAEGRANRQHPFAHAEVGGLADGNHRKACRFNFEHSHIGLGIAAQDFGLEFAPVGQLHGDLAGVGNHMGVG